ncbi:MAG: hypothetical protein ACREQ9_18110, partial [Candidatus Binatia bacterium]
MKEARLPDPRLTDHSDGLPATGFGEFEGFLELLHFALATDELGEPPARRQVELRPQRPGSDKLERLDRLAHPLHLRGPHRPEAEVAFRQPVRPLAHLDRS